MTPDHYKACSAVLHLEYDSMSLVKNYSFLAGNFLKYILRYQFKNDPVGDLLKAKDYMMIIKNEKDRKLYDIYRRPISVSSEIDLMVRAFKESFPWLNQCMNEYGWLFPCLDSYDSMLDLIDNEILQYSPQQN